MRRRNATRGFREHEQVQFALQLSGHIRELDHPWTIVIIDDIFSNDLAMMMV